MRSHLRTCISIVLCFTLGLSGCTTVSTHTRPVKGESDLSEAKVAIYWKDTGGERYHVGGLEVVLHPVGSPLTYATTATSDPAGPLYFRRLPPGRYRLRVTQGATEWLWREIRLDPGRQISVRVNVTGKKIAGGVADAAGEETAGDAADATGGIMGAIIAGIIEGAAERAVEIGVEKLSAEIERAVD